MLHWIWQLLIIVKSKINKCICVIRKQCPRVKYLSRMSTAFLDFFHMCVPKDLAGGHDKKTPQWRRNAGVTFSQHLRHWLTVELRSQQTQNICITFIQRRPNVFDVGPTLYKCYTNVLCLLGYRLNVCVFVGYISGIVQSYQHIGICGSRASCWRSRASRSWCIQIRDICCTCIWGIPAW